MATEQKETTEEIAKQKKSPILLIVILVIVVLLMGGAAAAYFFVLSPMMKDAASSTGQASAAPTHVQGITPGAGFGGPIKQMDSFIVNLTDAQGTRYLKVTMQFEMSNAVLDAEIDRKSPHIRDEIIMLLSSKSFDDVSSVAGKRALKRAIMNGTNKYLTSGQVVQIYFSEFVVQ
ncbi:MAG: flagellar basal body-associated FliL family protein [Desulfomonilia bacterium]|nr:flagellar basal body-associated FliL family protein [Desulfomonilia bacterium]